MYGFEIIDFLKKRCPDILPQIRGIVSIDMIKDIHKLNIGEFLIFNLSEKNRPGSHWLTLFWYLYTVFSTFSQITFKLFCESFFFIHFSCERIKTFYFSILLK